MTARKSNGLNAGSTKDPVIEASEFGGRHFECVITTQQPRWESLQKRRYGEASVCSRQHHRPVVVDGTAQATDIQNGHAQRDERVHHDIGKFQISTQSNADGGALGCATQQLKETAIKDRKS